MPKRKANNKVKVLKLSDSIKYRAGKKKTIQRNWGAALEESLP
jgi:hypothetical protein